MTVQERVIVVSLRIILVRFLDDIYRICVLHNKIGRELMDTAWIM